MPKPRNASSKGSARPLASSNLRRGSIPSFADDEDIDDEIKYDKMDTMMKQRSGQSSGSKSTPVSKKKYGFEDGSEDDDDEDPFEEYNRPVLGVRVDDDDDDEEEDEDEDEDEDDDDDDDEEDDPYFRKLKSLKNKIEAKADESDEDDEGAPETFDNVGSWGKSKAAFYGEDRERDDFEVDDEEKDEDEQQEEEEVKKLQKAKAALLKQTDYQDETLQEMLSVASKEKSAKSTGGKTKQEASLLETFNRDFDDVDFGVAAGSQVEKISKDVSKFTKEEKMQILLTESPELLEFLGDYKRCIESIQSKYYPSLKWLSENELLDSPVARFYQTKLGILTSYCSTISYYLLMKSSGNTVKDHPIIDQLVRLRGVMEKLNALDSDMDKVFKELKRNTAHAEKPKGKKESGKESNTPKDTISNMPSEDVVKGNTKSQVSRKTNSVSKTGLLRLEDEEKFYLNLSSVTKGDEKITKAVNRKSKLNDLTDFVDDSNTQSAKHNPLHRYINAASQAEKEKKSVSQDADVPVYEPKTKKLSAAAIAATEKDSRVFGGDDDEDEDDVFDLVKAQEDKSKKKAAKPPKPALNPPVAEGEKRQATKQIVVNRGLVRQRKKTNKNSRVKFRNKYSKAVTKSHSYSKQFSGQPTVYGGERTGIRTNVTHSVKIRS